MTPAAGVAHTRAGIAAVRLVPADADLDAPVPTCPGWSLRDLVVHVGNVHRWVTGAIVEGHPNTAEVDAPSGRAALLDWYDEGSGRLLDVLTGADPEQPCWTFGPKPRTVRFWCRRQAHEHAVHAHDARSAVGAAGRIDPALAADGIDEVVTMFFPRQVRLGRIAALTGSLAITPDDASRWVLAGDGTEALSLADAEVRGPAEALYLLLWGRIGLDDPRIVLDGDAEVAASVLAAGIVP
jgi:uncharacterized protein (TIGR03083 family)